MTDPIIGESPTPAQAPPGPRLYVGLDGVEVSFPERFWEDPSHDLVLQGRPRREWIIDRLALAIAAGLRQALASRQARSGSDLVGPDGRPVSS